MSTVTVPLSLNGAKSPGPTRASSPANDTVRVVRFPAQRVSAMPPPRTLSEPDAVALAPELIPDDAREHFGVFLLVILGSGSGRYVSLTSCELI